MWTFLLAFIPRAIVQGIPLLYGSTGEIITEKSGNLNLGILALCMWEVSAVSSAPSSMRDRQAVRQI